MAGFLLIWVCSRNVWEWQCWICGVWPKRETRALVRSAIQQGMRNTTWETEKVSYKWMDRAITLQRFSVNSNYILNVQTSLTISKIPFQLQVLPPRDPQTRNTADEPPSAVSDPKNAEAFLKEAGQMLDGWTQPEAQVPDGADCAGAELWLRKLHFASLWMVRAKRAAKGQSRASVWRGRDSDTDQRKPGRTLYKSSVNKKFILSHLHFPVKVAFIYFPNRAPVGCCWIRVFWTNRLNEIDSLIHS